MIRIAINGFGRIGRNFLRSVLLDKSSNEKIKVAAINIGSARSEGLAHMFKYDTLLGTYPGKLLMKEKKLIIDGNEIEILAALDPLKAEWKNLAIDWVVESSGMFTHRSGAEKHLFAGARFVLITAPAKDEDLTVIMGVNDEKFNKNHHKIVSLGSCTTNAVVPMLKVLNDNFEIENGFMTTIHSYTNTQVLLDIEKKDLRRSRAAALNIIPTTTGATNVIGRVIPELDGLIGGISVRVPVAKVSLIDLVFTSKNKLWTKNVVNSFKDVSEGMLNNILGVTYEPLVSSDFSGDSRSVIIDLSLVEVREKVGKVFGWYDNEWAYSMRIKDFLVKFS